MICFYKPKQIAQWIDDNFSIVVVLFVIGVLMHGCEASRKRAAIPPEPAYELEEQVGLAEGQARSSAWAKVRDAFVADNPTCAACGGSRDLNVHHIVPFHANPDLELDLHNLITLCREHHFRIGHDADGPWEPGKPTWKDANPQVREHASLVRGGKRY